MSSAGHTIDMVRRLKSNKDAQIHRKIIFKENSYQKIAQKNLKRIAPDSPSIKINESNFSKSAYFIFIVSVLVFVLYILYNTISR